MFLFQHTFWYLEFFSEKFLNPHISCMQHLVYICISTHILALEIFSNIFETHTLHAYNNIISCYGI